MLVSAFAGKAVVMENDPDYLQFKNYKDYVTISVSSSKTGVKLSTLIHDPKSTRYWESNNEKDSHFIVKFQEPVSCERYQLTTAYTIPKWWILEGTNDPTFSYWDLIDQKYAYINNTNEAMMCNCFPQRNAKICPIEVFDSERDNENLEILPKISREEANQYNSLVVPLDDPPKYDYSSFHIIQQQEKYKYYRFTILKNQDEDSYGLSICSFDMFTVE